MSRNSNEYMREYMKEYSKNYYRFALFLKRQEDSDIIAWLDEQKEWGYSYSEIARTALREYFEEKKEKLK